MFNFELTMDCEVSEEKVSASSTAEKSAARLAAAAGEFNVLNKLSKLFTTI